MTIEARDMPQGPAGPGPDRRGAQPAAIVPAKGVGPGRDARHLRSAQSFAQIVSVLMRDPGYRNLRVADLEWLVLPPVMAGQFRLAHAGAPADADKGRHGGAFIPIATALWARVSPPVDKTLSETTDKGVRLSPDAWTSGDIVWLMAVAGERRALPAFLKQLREREFKGRQVKMRLRTADGQLIISNLDQSAQAA